MSSENSTEKLPGCSSLSLLINLVHVQRLIHESGEGTICGPSALFTFLYPGDTGVRARETALVPGEMNAKPSELRTCFL